MTKSKEEKLLRKFFCRIDKDFLYSNIVTFHAFSYCYNFKLAFFGQGEEVYLVYRCKVVSKGFRNKKKFAKHFFQTYPVRSKIWKTLYGDWE